MGLVGRCRRRLRGIVAGVRRALGARLWTRPLAMAHATGTGTDLLRTRAQLLAENALLRQQLIVLRRGIKRPDVKRTDRALLVLLAGRVRAWRQALLVVQPATLLRWHRAGFRALWRRKSRPGPGRPPLPAETVDLIRRVADENPLWGAERIRGELAKLGLRVAKRTIQAYLHGSRAPRPRGQSWATFLRNHAAGIWVCDFLPVTDALFRPLYAFFVVELATRRVVHVGATRHPTDAWVAQQFREATPFDQHPRYLLRDNDAKFGAAFARRGGQWDRGAARALLRAAGQCGVRALPGQRAPRVSGPPAHPRRAPPRPGAPRVRHLLQPGPAAPGPGPSDARAAARRPGPP